MALPAQMALIGIRALPDEPKSMSSPVEQCRISFLRIAKRSMADTSVDGGRNCLAGAMP
jgi:hypothetical protein